MFYLLFLNITLLLLKLSEQSGDERVGDQSDEQHGADEGSDQFAVDREDGKAVLGDRVEDEAHDAERGEQDDPGDDLVDHVGDLGDDVVGLFRADRLQGKAEEDRPEKDAST